MYTSYFVHIIIYGVHEFYVKFMSRKNTQIVYGLYRLGILNVYISQAVQDNDYRNFHDPHFAFDTYVLLSNVF